MKKPLKQALTITSIAIILAVGFLFLVIFILQDKYEPETNVNFTEFENGRWLHEKDSLAGIEIKDGKWIMFYKGMEIDSSDVYDIKSSTDLPKFADTNLKPGEFLILTNKSDTLNYEIFGFDKEIISLLHFPSGRHHVYKAE